jgi:hypothetical protein
VRLISPPWIVARAEDVLRKKTTGTYVIPHEAIRELHEAMNNGKVIDPLKQFS